MSINKNKQREKRRVSFNENDENKENSFVSLTPVQTLFFEPDLSNGSENDPITFLNLPVVAVIELGKKLLGSGPASTGAIDFAFKLLNTPLFVTKTAGQLITGYDDPLVTLAHTIAPNLVKQAQFGLLNGVSWS